ncbi:rho GTPase-activating protein 20-like [Pollicipes pollicipes]|uniref:rho GTPase-activating protein 20-like n=1 Tax=Pollicipes pollicipes TaxID=41117 RepID=UPI001884B25B|nr:rho GTPase-activating protein 20-like [Pollicipes pollicipes]
MKSLVRKRSAPAARLQRALSAKSLRPPSSERSPSAEDGGDTMPPPDVPDSAPKRQFVMETAVQFTVGLQSQDRHLFLFSDMLLVAKARSGGNFKLKDKVRLSEMWLASCLDEVTEVTKDPNTSFVMGWPTTNVVATFSCPSTRDLWYNKLNQMITDERENEAKAINIQVVYYDQVNNIDFCKTLSVGSSLAARDCVRSSLTNLEMTGASAADYRLWVRTGLEDAPYPLIGHELPFAIKMNFVREFLSEDGVEMDHCNNIYNTDPSLKCQFILRHARKNCLTPSPDAAKKKKALKKSPIRIHKVFRRTNSKSDSIDSAISTCSSGLLFGQPLARLCENEAMPKPIMDILVQLFMKGPFTVGIFRKSANARVVKEMREKLDSEVDVNMESVNIYVLAALLKDFVRSLPDALLGSDLYDEWREVPEIENEQEKIVRVRELCARLPPANVNLLSHLLCVLHHIARRSHHNLMSAANVAVCVGPSLLAPANPAQVLTSDNAKLLPSVVEFLIDKCSAIFGPQCLTQFGPPPEREVRTDSGAEESDSLHSSGGGVRRDDSSIDSLERELLGENEPLPRKDKMSVTNLSRDSGLTLSDTQLYAPDDEESESTSSGHSGGKSVYSSGRGSDAGYRHYPAPANPSAIYAAVCRRQLAPTHSSPAAAEYGRAYSPAEGVYARPPVRHTNSHFKRQDWTRQHHPLRRTGRPATEGRAPMRRSASEESLLNSYGAFGRGSPAAHAPAEPPRDWQRSRSTPHIDEVDRSYDSSTLSDDDSTPHVSRSNSRSKDCALANDLWERTYGTLDSRSDSGSHASRHSSFKSSRTGSFSTVRSTGTVRSLETGTPPSYDVALSRRQWYQKSPGGSGVGGAARAPAHGVPEQVIREQTILSSRAKQLYEESLRIYAQQTAGPDMVHASPVRAVAAEDAPPPPPPLPPKTEAPPLPPKQKTPLKRVSGPAPGGGRLKQLPPVHVNVSESAPRRPAGAEQPPALPPKERTVIQIGAEPPPARPQRPKRKVSKREVETQTETEEGGEEAWPARPPHVTLVEIETSNYGEESYV